MSVPPTHLILRVANESAIDALPVLPGEHGFGPGIDPENVVDIEAIFKQKVRRAVYGLKKSDLKLDVKTTIPADVIIPTQNYVFRDGVKKYMENPPSELPLVILDSGKYYAQDHTRIAAQIMSGRSSIDVRLLEWAGGKYRSPKA